MYFYAGTATFVMSNVIIIIIIIIIIIGLILVTAQNVIIYFSATIQIPAPKVILWLLTILYCSLRSVTTTCVSRQFVYQSSLCPCCCFKDPQVGNNAIYPEPSCNGLSDSLEQVAWVLASQKRRTVCQKLTILYWNVLVSK